MKAGSAESRATSPTTEADMQRLRAALWHSESIAVIPLSGLDAMAAAFVTQVANKLYGARK